MWSVASFIFGIGFFIRGLSFIFLREWFFGPLDFLKNKIPITFSISTFILFMSFSLLTLTRDYLGPVEDISDCEDGPELRVYCVLSNPEDILKTPDEKYFIVSEFGGIKPYEEPNSISKSSRIFVLKLKRARLPCLGSSYGFIPPNSLTTKAF